MSHKHINRKARHKKQDDLFGDIPEVTPTVDLAALASWHIGSDPQLLSYQWELLTPLMFAHPGKGIDNYLHRLSVTPTRQILIFAREVQEQTAAHAALVAELAKLPVVPGVRRSRVFAKMHQNEPVDEIICKDVQIIQGGL